ncbi:acyl-CoA dehydrogenase family protein [Aquihabitans sp. McL0605]|uniref:acyl-CoA dehydrogenase family protein n=1 Tax=Aquihabitans sp. McL0605 TaxID=3415671 RepID=UPI003CEA96C3
MEFRLDEGQIELQQTVARFCTDRFPFDRIAGREGAAVDRSAWTELAGLGVLGLLLPEASGGVGLGVIEAAIVFEQLGSHLVPGPVLWSLLAAPLVPGAATGEVLVGGVEASAVVDGTVVVAHARDIDVLLVVGDDGVTAHRTADLPDPTPYEPLDPLTSVGRFTGLGSGEPIGAGGAAAHLRPLGTVLTAALLAGVSSRALDVAREYALEREQFGAAIGSFQAIKHLLADMYVRTVSAQSVTYAAAAVLDEPGDDDVRRAVARAKVLASDAAIANSSAAIQVLGGMGFTWDMLPNHLLKRAWLLEHDFGTTEAHELHLGSTLEGARS